MGGWLTSRPGRFTLENNQVPIVLEDGWAPGSVWTGAENLASPGFDSRMVQYVASEIPITLSRPTAILILHKIAVVRLCRCKYLRDKLCFMLIIIVAFY